MQRIEGLVNSDEANLIALRRLFHQHAETAWCEFWTSAFLQDELEKLGYSLQLGQNICYGPARMGVPSKKSLADAAERACMQGADVKRVAAMAGGYTGVVADLLPSPAPRIALRFDIDANALVESCESNHRPHREGFISKNNGACHACGHDGHATIGLGLARLLSTLRSEIPYNIRLIFQPAEEGVCGAKSMVEAGVVEGIEQFYSIHLGLQARQRGEIVCASQNFLATSKFDIYFSGRSAHAAASPESGANSLLAAAATALQLHAIAPHSAGRSQIHVGQLTAGTGRNVVADSALLRAESRGISSELDEYVVSQMKRIVRAAAIAYQQKYEIRAMGNCGSGQSDQIAGKRFRDSAEKIAYFKPELVRDTADFGASDDVTEFMRVVQDGGGFASYAMLGTELAASHHNPCFDFDESVLAPAVKLLARIALNPLLS